MKELTPADWDSALPKDDPPLAPTDRSLGYDFVWIASQFSRLGYLVWSGKYELVEYEMKEIDDSFAHLAKRRGARP